MNFNLRERFFRTKHIPVGHLDTKLRRCLSTFDLSLLGVGHMIGAGIYVLTGSVIASKAGPAAIISYFFAGIAAVLSALCYAEFGARYPKAGSAYTYAYVGCGELWAFIVGWNIVLEHMLSGAAVARAWSAYFNDLVDQSVSNFTIETFGQMGSRGSLIGEYPDFIAAGLVIIACIFVGWGSKAATSFNSLFTVLNLSAIVFTVGYGSFQADFSLWQGTMENGNSRFMPYGWDGVWSGAAACFFSYIGFDGLATAGEEAKTPAKSIPRATYICMSIVCVAYVLMAGTLALLVPFENVHTDAAFAEAFRSTGHIFASRVVTVSALFGMTTSLFGSLFALPRCVYAMAEDGLVFSLWAKVNNFTKMPLITVFTFGVMACVCAFIFDLEALVDFLSIGTLLAYSIVSASVILLRYQPAPLDPENPTVLDKGGKLRFKIPYLSQWEDSMVPGNGVMWTLFVLLGSIVSVSVLLNNDVTGHWVGLVGLTFSAVMLLASTLYIYAHHQNELELSFKVFWVPFLPIASLLINFMMMTHLAYMTWVRLFIWMAIGMAIYMMYGMRHSLEEKSKRRVMPSDFSVSSRVAFNAEKPPIE